MAHIIVDCDECHHDKFIVHHNNVTGEYMIECVACRNKVRL